MRTIGIEFHLVISTRHYFIIKFFLLKTSLDTPRHSGENFLSSSSNELTVLHKCPHNNECKRQRCKRERVIVKSIEDVNGDTKVVPSFLLTYNSKFSKISNETYRSCSSININEIYEDSSEA